jgi:hypothetical protein
MRAVKTVSVAVTALLCLTLLGTPAQAATVVKEDRANDAPARIDIRRVTYAYGDGQVKVRARIPQLGRAGKADLSITKFEIFEAGYVLRIAKWRGERARVRLYYFDHFSLNRRRCDGIAGQWNDANIRMTVPTECLTGHARRRIRVQFGIQHRQDIDRAPAVRRLARD